MSACSFCSSTVSANPSVQEVIYDKDLLESLVEKILKIFNVYFYIGLQVSHCWSMASISNFHLSLGNNLRLSLPRRRRPSCGIH